MYDQPADFDGQSEANPSLEQAMAALALLRAWQSSASAEEQRALDLSGVGLPEGPNAYPNLSRVYPVEFRADEAYRDTLPDLQNGPSSLIVGAKTRIQHVGISNFRLPLTYLRRDGSPVQLETSVSGSVSLEAEQKGINMSRIMRSFYAHADQTFGFDAIEAVLDAYKKDLGSFDARLQLRFAYPMRLQSLRSGLEGWQYYDVALELVEQAGQRLRIMHLDYVYSSTCPCSTELSEHARRFRNQLATPHSQRSVARLSVVLQGDLGIEELVELARKGVITETQVMVKREDEQAFAELNGANPIFVEDAARSFCAALQSDGRIGDFRVVASHQESLHSHDAISLLTHGSTFANASLDPRLFQSLIHVG